MEPTVKKMRGARQHLTRSNRQTQTRAVLTLLLLVFLLSACAQLGPGLVKAGRNDYNVAVAQTDDEQVLLNLVRLRYADNPLWMNVGSVTTQFNFAQGASAAVEEDVALRRYGLRVGTDLRFSETPTISYTPLAGTEYVRNVLAPMDFTTFMLLANAGWSIERLLWLAGSRMNGLKNAIEAEGPAPTLAPRYAEFARAAKLLRVLQKKDVLRFRYRDPGKDTMPAVYIEADALDWAETRELRELLGLKVRKRFYALHSLADKPNPDAIGLQLRSLSGMVHFLSTAVEVPARDEEAGRVTVAMDENGQRFDWSRVMKGLFRIRSQNEQPTDAAVAVLYRNAWFYIADSDIDTKYTFRLLDQVSSILAGKIEKGVKPVLTLPVGGG